jgi:DNA (cytosine-5)-methyltransferase 1
MRRKIDGPIIDLYCGAGGASVGIAKVFPNHPILGIDIRPQPHYPFMFLQADVMSKRLQSFLYSIKPYFVWASPPCQGYSHRSHSGIVYPRLIPQTRRLLRNLGCYYAIENLTSAPLKGTLLCGTYFALGVLRHRLIETNYPMPNPIHLPHMQNGISSTISVAGNNKGTLREKRLAMFDSKDLWRFGANYYGGWMDDFELRESIPAEYAKYTASYIPKI